MGFVTRGGEINGIVVLPGDEKNMNWDMDREEMGIALLENSVWSNHVSHHQ
jgi:hypothetical protein